MVVERSVAPRVLADAGAQCRVAVEPVARLEATETPTSGDAVGALDLAGDRRHLFEAGEESGKPIAGSQNAQENIFRRWATIAHPENRIVLRGRCKATTGSCLSSKGPYQCGQFSSWRAQRARACWSGRRCRAVSTVTGPLRGRLATSRCSICAQTIHRSE